MEFSCWVIVWSSSQASIWSYLCIRGAIFSRSFFFLVATFDKSISSPVFFMFKTSGMLLIYSDDVEHVMYLFFTMFLQFIFESSVAIWNLFSFSIVIFFRTIFYRLIALCCTQIQASDRSTWSQNFQEDNSSHRIPLFLFFVFVLVLWYWKPLIKTSFLFTNGMITSKNPFL